MIIARLALPESGLNKTSLLVEIFGLMKSGLLSYISSRFKIQNTLFKKVLYNIIYSRVSTDRYQ